MVTGTPFQITGIRANRSKPGLMRQHLAGVNAAASLCSAAVDGAALGSSALTFAPGPVRPGDYTFDVGSAGSTGLVLQAILPALVCAPGPSRLTLIGGTHNIYAPPFDFLQHALLPLVGRMGPRVEASLERHGFYPVGGGRIVVSVDAVALLSPMQLERRGPVQQRQATALVAGLPPGIADRELKRVAERLGWDGRELQARELPDPPGPGNVLTLLVQSEQVAEVFTGFGQRGVPAEAVADAALNEATAYLAADVPVGPHLADQLLVFLALAGGGSFVTGPLTPHTTTNIETIGRFLPQRFAVEPLGEERWRVSVAY